LIHAYPLTELAIAEGVETALSAYRLLDKPAWAMCGGFPSTLPLSDSVRSVDLVADNDLSGGSVSKAKVLASWLRQEGRYVKVMRPSTPGHDANDLLRGAA
jgi:hypothetical protein